MNTTNPNESGTTTPPPHPKKKVSKKQLAANRANAKRSTGPKSDDGKKRSSLNATRHGLTAQVAVLPGEDFNAFFEFCRKFRESLHPAGFQEEQLAQSLAELRWRLNRVSQLENSIFALGFETHGAGLDVNHPDAHVALSNALTYLEDGNHIGNLTLLAARLTRQYEKEFAQLRALQSERKATETEALSQAYALAKSNKAIGKTYEPSEDGFVFSRDHLEQYISRRDRLELAHNAASRTFPQKIRKRFAA